MSILIKGMEMPQKKYGYVLVIYPDGKVHCQDGEEYQAVPVPPHGRLGDMDALLEGIANDAIWKHDAMNEYDSGIRTGARTIMRLIRNAPTIIEAEGGET